MGTELFEDRERANEAFFCEQQEAAFRIESHAVKALGLWAAQKLDMATVEQAERYANSLLGMIINKAETQDIIEKIYQDFVVRRVPLSRHRIDIVFKKELEKASVQIEGNS
jgi:hypothetical protein